MCCSYVLNVIITSLQWLHSRNNQNLPVIWKLMHAFFRPTYAIHRLQKVPVDRVSDGDPYTPWASVPSLYKSSRAELSHPTGTVAADLAGQWCSAGSRQVLRIYEGHVVKNVDGQWKWAGYLYKIFLLWTWHREWAVIINILENYFGTLIL